VGSGFRAYGDLIVFFPPRRCNRCEYDVGKSLSFGDGLSETNVCRLVESLLQRDMHYYWFFGSLLFLYVVGFGMCWIVLSLAGLRARLTFVE
jgi:hypothetical protein